MPPVVAAFQAIANRQRGRILIGSLLLPLPLLFVLLVGDRLLFGASGYGAQPGAVLGIAPLVLLVDGAAAVLFMTLAARYRAAPAARTDSQT